MATDFEAGSSFAVGASGVVDRFRLRRLVHESVRRGEQRLFNSAEDAVLSRAESQYATALKQRGRLELADGSSVNRGDRFRRTSIRGEDGCILFALVLALEPECIVELGTSLGASALFMAAAINYLGKGELHTIELNGDAQAIAREHVSEAGFDRVTFHQGTFQDLLDPLLARLSGVRLAFIDGHHKERPTWSYFRRFLEHAAPPAVLVFDDIGWSEEMDRVWRRISEHPAVDLAVSTDKLGIVLLVSDD